MNRGASRPPWTLMLGLTLWILGLVWQKNEATRLGYGVAEALSDYRAISSRVEGMEARLEREFSPESLARDASRELGLGVPDISRLRFLETRGPASEGLAEFRRRAPRARLKG